MIDKVASDKINTDTVQLLYKYGKENYAARPSKFVNILDNIFTSTFDSFFKESLISIIFEAPVDKKIVSQFLFKYFNSGIFVILHDAIFIVLSFKFSHKNVALSTLKGELVNFILFFL